MLSSLQTTTSSMTSILNIVNLENIFHYDRHCCFEMQLTRCLGTYNLGIDQDGDDVNNLPCTYVDTASDPNTHSFFGVSCQENNDFQLSWGWSPDSTFATMTIKQVSSSEQYYFGYLEPNSASDYADQQGNA